MGVVMIDWLLSVAFLVAIVWGLVTIAELKRGQRALIEDMTRLTQGLGFPRPAKPVVTCERCGAQYDAELTGCNVCGRAKPKGADAPSADLPGAAR